MDRKSDKYLFMRAGMSVMNRYFSELCPRRQGLGCFGSLSYADREHKRQPRNGCSPSFPALNPTAAISWRLDNGLSPCPDERLFHDMPHDIRERITRVIHLPKR